MDHFTPEVLASAELVEEVSTGAAKVVKVSTRCGMKYRKTNIFHFMDVDEPRLVCRILSCIVFY